MSTRPHNPLKPKERSKLLYSRSHFQFELYESVEAILHREYGAEKSREKNTDINAEILYPYQYISYAYITG